MPNSTRSTKRTIVKVIASVLGLSSTMTLAACGGNGDSSSAGDNGLTVVRIGVAAPTAEQALPQIAQDLGIFEEHGIQAKIELVAGGPQITAGLIGGSLDFGVYSAPGPEVGMVQGAKVKYVGVWSHHANLGLVVSPGIDSVADLKGKSIAVSSPGTTTAIYTHMALADAGLDPEKDVIQRNVGSQGAALSAFASGQVQAAVFGAPVTYAALSKVADSKLLIDFSKQDFTWPYAGIVASDDYTSKHSDTVKDVLAALQAAAKDYKDPAKADQIKAVISKFTQTTGASVDRSFEVAANEIDATLTPAAEDHRNVLTKLAATTPQAADFDVSKVFQDTFVKEAQR